MSAYSNDSELETVDLRFAFDHELMRQRDHHVMHFLRVQADDSDLGTVKIRVPAVDRLWQSAFELGVQCGAALRKAADKGKRK